jgi:hypothetical protein
MKAHSPSLMKKTSPEPCKEGERQPKTRLGKIKQKLKGLKKKLTKEKDKTVLESRGCLKGQWSQKDLPKIVKRIVDAYPGITSIEIYATEIRWHTELNYYDLFPKKKFNGDNPSKREEEQ